MKVSASLFLVIILILPLKSVSQQNYVFKSIAEANSVLVDSVFRLDLSKNKLTVFPKEILKYKNLKELYLSKNKLSELPQNFHKLKQLEVLDLSKNKFTKFPQSLCRVTSLKQLFMGRNQMTVIPECIGKLTELIVLDIWYNQIDGLPNSMSNLKKLKNLDLRGVNFNSKTQIKIKALIPWCNIEFDTGCDCVE